MGMPHCAAHDRGLPPWADIPCHRQAERAEGGHRAGAAGPVGPRPHRFRNGMLDRASAA